MKRTIFLAPLLWGLAAGCQSTGIPLHDTSGKQWVWPYFAQVQPTVLAFWNTYEMRCIEDLPALNGFDNRDGSIQLVSVCTTLPEDRRKVDKWCRKEGVQFPVIVDSERRLARRLGVKTYPTYILFDVNGNELSRRTDIRTVHNWFDRPRWYRKAVGEHDSGRVEYSSYP